MHCPARRAASAHTQVTIYGIAAIEMIHVTGEVAGAAGAGSLTKTLDNSQVTTSRLGFRGIEDLGGGIGAIYGLESGIGLAPDAAQAPPPRSGAVAAGGPAHRLGTLTAGRHWNINDYIMGRYFVFGGYSAFRFSEFGFLSELVDNSLKYVSQLGRVPARGLYALGEGTTGCTAESG